MNFLEILAFVTALLNIYLVTKHSLWNWLFGIIAVILYAIIFFEAKLYADMGLQGVFLIFQFYGLYQWLYGGSLGKPLAVQLANTNIYRVSAIISVILFAVISWILNYYTDSNTIFSDAGITTLSLIAQWMMSKKYLQHWILWVIVDSASVILYSYKALYLTALLYFIFLLLCITGYRNWKQYLATDQLKPKLI